MTFIQVRLVVSCASAVAMSSKLENMTAENLTTNDPAATTINTTIHYATKTAKIAEFFDPAWQLAMTI